MKTYQDLVAVGDDIQKRAEFVKTAINSHKNSEEYAVAYAAEEYYKRNNLTINNFKKFVYDVTGQPVEDIWGSNYKISSGIYRRFVIQEVQFLLGNGISWKNEETANKLGTAEYPIDIQLQDLATKAVNGKVGFGLWAYDHVDTFSLNEFAPLYDEENGSLKAGIRHWQVDLNKPKRATLYEIDGITEFIWYRAKKGFVLSDEWVVLKKGLAYKPKKAYTQIVSSSEIDGEQIVDGENYSTFPIVPLFANKEHISEFSGLREKIDCMDLIASGYANSVDDASFIYWTLQNAGGYGSDDQALKQFVEKMKVLKAVDLPEGMTAQANTINLPYQANEAILSRLESDLYRDAMALDVQAIANGAVNTTQIKAAYEPLNEKCDGFEYCIIDFLNRIMKLAGVEDEPTFTRSMISNTTEELQALTMAAANMANEDVVKRTYELLGMSDKAEEALESIEIDNQERFEIDTTEEEAEIDGDMLEEYGAEVEEMLNGLLEELNG